MLDLSHDMLNQQNQGATEANKGNELVAFHAPRVGSHAPWVRFDALWVRFVALESDSMHFEFDLLRFRYDSAFVRFEFDFVAFQVRFRVVAECHFLVWIALCTEKPCDLWPRVNPFRARNFVQSRSSTVCTKTRCISFRISRLARWANDIMLLAQNHVRAAAYKRGAADP